MTVEDAGDGHLVLDADRGRVHYLNHTAARVLALCDGTRTVDEIVTAIQRSFGLERPPAEDVRDCLVLLHNEGLVG